MNWDIYGYLSIHQNNYDKYVTVAAIQNNESPWKNGIEEYSKNIFSKIKPKRKYMETAIIESYYNNDAKRLRKLVDSILVKFGGIYDKDKDDFYSIGNEVFVSAIRSYVDGKQSFDSYLRGCISNRVKTEITRRNAAKRSADVVPMTAINEDGEESEMDVASDFDLEEDILSGESAKEIYENLSSLGKKIVQLRLQGKSDVEIKSILNITQSDLANETKKMQTTTLRKITKTTTSK